MSEHYYAKLPRQLDHVPTDGKMPNLVGLPVVLADDPRRFDAPSRIVGEVTAQRPNDEGGHELVIATLKIDAPDLADVDWSTMNWGMNAVAKSDIKDGKKVVTHIDHVNSIAAIPPGM